MAALVIVNLSGLDQTRASERRTALPATGSAYRMAAPVTAGHRVAESMPSHMRKVLGTVWLAGIRYDDTLSAGRTSGDATEIRRSSP